MLFYNTGSWSAGDIIVQQNRVNMLLNRRATLYNKNRFRMMLCNTGSWLEGEYIPGEPGQHPDQQATLYQKNRARMLLYNPGS